MKTPCFLIVVLLVLAASPRAFAGYIDLPKDNNGWSIFTLADNARVIYVAADGTDTCSYYEKGDPLVGSNPFEPAGTIVPCASYTKARSYMRGNYGDWILFKRGDTFYAGPMSVPNGLSEAYPSLMGAYGVSGLSPVIKHGAEFGIRMQSAIMTNIAFSGVAFYAQTRDPTNIAEYVSAVGNPNITLSTSTGKLLDGVLFEGCKFLYGDNNVLSDSAGGEAQNIVFRRNVFLNNYPEGAYVQGLYAAGIDGIKLEENIFDHNGWSDDELGSSGQLSHNTYFAGVKNTTFTGNTFSRGSNMNNKFTSPDGNSYNITIDNNLNIASMIGIDIGTNYVSLPLRFKNISIINNVLTNIGRENSTGQGLAQYLQIAGWDEGIVNNNIFMNQPGDLEHSGFAINVWNAADLTVDSNVFYKIEDNTTPYLVLGSGEMVFNYTNNIIQNPNGSQDIFRLSNLTGRNFAGNTYYDAGGPSAGFLLNSVDLSFANWVSASGDTSTYGQYTFPDATRTVETYLGTLGETQTIDRYIELIRAQDRYNWRYDISAENVNDYIRAGFGVTKTSALAPISPISNPAVPLSRRLSLGGRPIKLVEPGP